MQHPDVPIERESHPNLHLTRRIEAEYGHHNNWRIKKDKGECNVEVESEPTERDPPPTFGVSKRGRHGHIDGHTRRPLQVGSRALSQQGR